MFSKEVSFRYIVALAVTLLLGLSLHASTPSMQDNKQKKPSKRELKALAKAREAAQAADTVATQADTIIVDTLTGDSIRYLSGARPDTMVVTGGIMPMVDAYRIKNMTRRDSTGKLIKEEEALPPSPLAMERSKLFKDTVAFSKLTMMSFLVPGYGQLYNNQAWKIPVVYAAAAGFSVLAIDASSKANTYNQRYLTAVKEDQSQDDIDYLRYRSNKFKTHRNFFMMGAFASYIYSIGDAAINYKGVVNKTNKATTLSAIFPGAGQIYNGSYWKLPIVYGGLAVCAFVVDYNNRGYQRFKTAYTAVIDDDPDTVDEFNGAYSSTVLKNTRDSYRRYRDMGIVYTVGFYLLNIIDAHVDAYLRRYDISDDLSMKIEPTNDKIYLPADGGVNVVGMSMKVNF